MENWRTTTDWKLAGTETFRLASAKRLGKWGGNLQNINDRVARIIIPDEGKIFCQADQAGAEALVVSYIAPKGAFRELFQVGIKSHIFVAMHLFAKYWDRWTLSSEEGRLGIEKFLTSSISELPKLPKWKELTSKIKKHDKYYALAKMTCHACVTGEHEVLTEEGWIKLADLEENTAILTYGPKTSCSFFSNPLRTNSFDYTGNLFVIDEEDFSQIVTPEHKMLYEVDGIRRICFARELEKGDILVNQIYPETGGYPVIPRNEKNIVISNTIKQIAYHGKVYCPTTSTGFFVVRHQGKISVCGNSNYGMMPGTFRLNVLQRSEGKIVLSAKEAESFIETYHALFPEIRRWHQEVENILYTTRELRNRFGFPRKFYGPLNDETFKSAYSFDPQSTVGTITNLAFTAAQAEIEKEALPFDLLINKHDSILAQCPVGMEATCCSFLKRHLELSLVGRDSLAFNMKSEATVGKNWAKYNEATNLEGMREHGN